MSWEMLVTASFSSLSPCWKRWRSSFSLLSCILISRASSRMWRSRLEMSIRVLVSSVSLSRNASEISWADFFIRQIFRVRKTIMMSRTATRIHSQNSIGYLHTRGESSLRYLMSFLRNTHMPAPAAATVIPAEYAASSGMFSASIFVYCTDWPLGRKSLRNS